MAAGGSGCACAQFCAGMSPKKVGTYAGYGARGAASIVAQCTAQWGEAIWLNDACGSLTASLQRL